MGAPWQQLAINKVQANGECLVWISGTADVQLAIAVFEIEGNVVVASNDYSHRRAIITMNTGVTIASRSEHIFVLSNGNDAFGYVLKRKSHGFEAGGEPLGPLKEQ